MPLADQKFEEVFGISRWDQSKSHWAEESANWNKEIFLRGYFSPPYCYSTLPIFSLFLQLRGSPTIRYLVRNLWSIFCLLFFLSQLCCIQFLLESLQMKNKFTGLIREMMADSDANHCSIVFKNQYYRSSDI